MTKNNQSLKDKLSKITDEAIQIERKKSLETLKAIEKQNSEKGKEIAEYYIKSLPKKMTTAAQEGKNHITLAFSSYDVMTPIVVSHLINWAKEQNFSLSREHNQEPANEGGDMTDYLTISW